MYAQGHAQYRVLYKCIEVTVIAFDKLKTTGDSVVF